MSSMYAGKTLYVSDLDGTLLNSKAVLSEYTAGELNRMLAEGLCFSVATARSYASAGIILKDLKLRLPIVLMNGVLIYDITKNEYIKVYNLAEETSAMIINLLRECGITGFMYELKDGVFNTYHETLEQEPLRDFAEERIKKYNKSFTHTEGFKGVCLKNAVYFTLLDKKERLLPVKEAAQTLDGLNCVFYPDVYRRDLWYLEIFSIEASKRNAVDYLRETLGFSRVVGFGDNLNDLPMFLACDVRVAVKNAKKEVIAAADYICGANDNNGVIKWLISNT